MTVRKIIATTGPEQSDRPAPPGAPRASTSEHDGAGQFPSDQTAADPFRVLAKQLLKVRMLWAVPAVVGSVLFVLITVFYIGSVVDPVGHLRGLPVSIVNEDPGVTIGPRHFDFGAQLESGLTSSPKVTRPLALEPQRLPAAKDRMNRNGAYATMVIPANFTASLLSLTGVRVPAAASAGKPTVELLTNLRAGGLGVSLASGVLEPAIAQASHRLGSALVAQTPRAPANAATAAVLADPITFASLQYRPLPSHSALGSSAFYIALLTLICGFVAAVIINAAVDVGTGYATSEIGPRWSQRQPLPINRWQTLLTKWAMAVPITGLLTGLMLIVAVGILGMNAPNAGLLWLFTWLAAASVAVGTLVLVAVLGTQGQLIALLLFIYLGLASAGGTVPLEALPRSLKALGQIEPLRQILAGTRSILYFNASGDAGLTRGLIAASAGLAFWLVLGAVVVRWYDRSGFHRIRPDLLAYVNRAFAGYHAQAQAQRDDERQAGAV